MSKYVHNAWYVAGWEEEIIGNSWLARRLLDEPRLIYRTDDGAGYVMLADRCPHRFAPLSLGKRQHDNVVCRYHGLTFGPTGDCVQAAYGGKPPTHVKVASTPIYARNGLLWFWPGDLTIADPKNIPDFSFLDSVKHWRRRSLFAGNYELLSDNLLDLSHVDHLHVSTFGTGDSNARAIFNVYEGERDTLWAEWKIPDIKKPLFMQEALRDADHVDQLLKMRWNAPASMVLEILWMPAGGTPDQAVFSVINPHIVTPETSSTSHYFWTCDPNPDSEKFARAVFETEDRPMIEAVQSYMGSDDFWDLRPSILKQDLGAIRARRRLIKLRAGEQPSSGKTEVAANAASRD